MAALNVEVDFCKLKQDLADGYDVKAQCYAESVPPIHLKEFLADQIRAFYSQVLTSTSTKPVLLDLGAGPGNDAKYLQEMGADITCVDLSTEMLSLCMGKNLKIRKEDFCNLTIPDSSVDGIIMNFSFLHIPKNHGLSTLESVRQKIKACGSFLITVFEGSGEGFEIKTKYPKPRYFSYYSTDEIVHLLQSAGYISLDIQKLENKPRNVISVICQNQNSTFQVGS